jgi:hypothetical protein
MANPFAVQFADALENSRPAVARPNQLPPTGDWWQIWLLLAGRGFGKTRALAEWVCQAGGIGAGQPGCPCRGHGGGCPRRLGRRTKRHSRGRAALVSAGLRGLETATDLAEWRTLFVIRAQARIQDFQVLACAPSPDCRPWRAFRGLRGRQF